MTRGVTPVQEVQDGGMRSAVVLCTRAPSVLGSVRRLWEEGVELVEIELDPTSDWTPADRELLREELIATGREALARRLRGKQAEFRCLAFAETGDLRSAEPAGPWFRRVAREVGKAVTAGLARGQRRAPMDGLNPSALVHVHGPLAVLLSAALTLSALVFAGAVILEEVAPTPQRVLPVSYLLRVSRPIDVSRELRQPQRGIFYCSWPPPQVDYIYPHEPPPRGKGSRAMKRQSGN